MRLVELKKICSHALNIGISACLLLIAPQIGWAAGTLSGTTISNSATLTYAIGAGPATTATSNTVSFTVDEKVNLTVAGTGVAIPVVPGSSTQVATFTVTNNSNSPLDFSLVANQPSGGSYLGLTDNFDATGCIARVESNPVPDGYQTATDIGTFVDELAADGTATVYEVCDIPSGQNNGDAAIVGLTATAQGNFTGANNTYAATAGSLGNLIVQTAGSDTPGAVDIVFTDIAGSEGDGVRDTKHSARDVYSVVNGVNVILTKTVPSKVDPNGTGMVMPGSVMTYQIAVDLTGSGTAANLVITDPLPANTTYLANSITVNGAPQTDAVDPLTDNTDFGITNANTVTVNLGNVAAPATHVITFKATIN